MSTDFCIHVLADGISEEEVEYFKQPVHAGNDTRYYETYYNIANLTPRFDVGENDDYLAGVVDIIDDAIGYGCTLLTEDVLQKILMAFESHPAWREEVEQFLKPHVGQKIFTVIW